MGDIERRLATLETKVAEMEARRARLVPAELDNNPSVELVLKDSLDGFTAKLKSFAAQKGLDEAQTRFTLAKDEARRELERLVKEGERKELAELVAAIRILRAHRQIAAGVSNQWLIYTSTFIDIRGFA